MLRLKSALLAVACALAAACASPEKPCALQPSASMPRVYVVSHGWHVDLGIPAGELAGPLAVYRDLFPGARAFMFGYGKRTFLTAPPDDIGEYILGPIPGPAAIEVVALNVLPPDAYAAGETIALALPAGGAEALSRFIWNDLMEDRAGRPLLVGSADFPGGVFYAAVSRYTLLHTCNRWAVDALAAAGLPIAPAGVIFSGQAMDRAEAARNAQCRAANL